MSNLPAPSQWPPLDLQAILGASRPGGNIRKIGLIVPAAWGMVVAAAIFGRPAAVQTTLTFIAIGATAAVSLTLRSLARGFERERLGLSRIEDQLALKQVGPVMAELAVVLSRPMRTAENRLRALLLLATALSRSDRQEDALALYDELLDHERVAGPGADAVRIARTMALLRVDRLYDADRAISDLRRTLTRPRSAERPRGSIDTDALPSPAIQDPAANGSGSADAESANDPDATTAAEPIPPDPLLFAATRLVELYRDVKTGHPADAIEMFETDRQALRHGLGHRYAEALALVAAAHDRLGNADAAAQYFADATALAPLADLIRKYPELATLPPKYAITLPPMRG